MVLTLPANGIRLRFDGPQQRLRLIEIIDFTKSRITYQDKDLVRTSNTTQGAPGSPKLNGASDALSGPAFKNVYHRLFGPTYAGEYIPPAENDKRGIGTYILSYPGVAFSFPLPESAYSPDKDVVTLLSSPASQTAISGAIFSGKSWAHARETLWTESLPSIKSSFLFSKGKDVVPDEISLVRIHGGGRLQLFRKWTSASVWISLGDTTPQDLVAELGPPDAIYRKNDQRMYIHKTRAASNSRTRSHGGDYKRPDELTDTDQSSVHTGPDDSDDEAIEDDFIGNVSGECFFNYFYLGFDVLISPPVPPSRKPPSQEATGAGTNGENAPPTNGDANPLKAATSDRLVATKVVLHANVPGSYPFNRHRRCRWEISYLGGAPTTIGTTGSSSNGSDTGAADSTSAVINSETHFNEIEERLREEWKRAYAPDDDAGQQRQRGMVLNRGWGDSPGSSCEFLGGWEDNSTGGASGGSGLGLGLGPGGGGLGVPGAGGAKKFDGSEDSTTTLYGFPGLVFEVLKNGFVSAVTVF